MAIVIIIGQICMYQLTDRSLCQRQMCLVPLKSDVSCCFDMSELIIADVAARVSYDDSIRAAIQRFSQHSIITFPDTLHGSDIASSS